MVQDLASDLIVDLLRSAWIVEAARAEVYGAWAEHDGAWGPSRARAGRRAELIAHDIEARGQRPDAALVAGHAAWMRRVSGNRPGEVPLAEFFIARLADWTDAHAGPFLAAAEEVQALSDEEKAGLGTPDSWPQPPPFEPLEVPRVAAPGDTIFRFGILGDLHIGSTRAEAAARAAVRDLNAAGVDLVIQLGDITDHGNADEFARAAEVIDELEMPIVTMMGNHDVYSHDEAALAGRTHYPKSFGRDPEGVLLDHKGWRFAVLDSAEHAVSPFGPFDLVTGTFGAGSGGAVVHGTLTPPQHEILAEVAAPGAPPAFVFLHHPVQPFTGFPPLLFGLREADSGRLHAVADSGNVWGVFAGHTHRNARTRDFDGVPCHEVAIPRDFPCGYAVVDVGPGGYVYRFVQLSDRDLLRDVYSSTGSLFRRYAAGAPEERAFVFARA